MFNPKLTEEPPMDVLIRQANEEMLKELSMYTAFQSNKTSLPVVNLSQSGDLHLGNKDTNSS